MEQWEYMTRFVTAHIDNEGAKEFLKEAFPEWKNPPKFTPESMIPELNDLGADGWELIHMQPVPDVGANSDIGFPFGGSGNAWWSNQYFCVFKRRVSEEE